MIKTTLVAATVFVATLAAQAPPAAAKTPRPPVVGADQKTAPVAPVKTAPRAPAASPAPGSFPRTRPEADKATADPIARSIRAAMGARDPVLFDQPTPGGALWFQGANYKASFDARGWQFVAQPANGADAALPVRFRTTALTISGTTTPVAELAPTRVGNRVEYRHDAFVEAIDMRGDAVEQTFRFDSLPTRGELLLTIATDSGRDDVDLGDGIEFRGAADHVGYTEAIATDADGASVRAETLATNGTITIRVPAAFVAAARLPLVVDPVVTSSVVYNGATADLSNPDIAWDEGSQSWTVAFERLFSANDIDVYTQRLDANLAPIGGITVVDSTLDVWQQPKLANLRLYGKFLVVAQTSVDAPAPYWIAGRVLDSAGTLTTGQFDIERAGLASHQPGDKIRPGVGGDPVLSGPTYFTVVWERVLSATDHDVHMKQVTDLGVLRSAAPTFIDNSLGFESNPSISRTDGPAPFAQQRFVVCYQRTFGPTDEDVRGSLLTWDGQFVLVGGATNYSVDASFANDTRPQPSTPTDGGANGTRHTMFVYQRTTANNGDVAGSVGTIDGTMLAFADLTALENNPTRLAWPQYNPGVDCDGTRFGVVYQELFNGAGADYDTRIDLFGFDTNTNTIVIQESALTLGFSGDAEFNPRIASRYAGSGARSTRYATTHERSFTAPFTIEAWGYDGYVPASLTSRTTQCGTLGIAVTGSPTIGFSLDFTLATAFPVAGFDFGTPASVGIPTCACTLGVNGTLIVTNPLHVDIPSQVSLVGAAFSVQGFTFEAGPCLGSVSVSDTIDFTLQ